MKTKASPNGFPCDESIIVDFHELISLLMGKDFASRQAFRKDVLKRAAKIRTKRRKGNLSVGQVSNIIRFPMGGPCAAWMETA